MGDAVGEKRAASGGDKVGESLLALGRITRAQLEEAFSVQRHDRRQLGQILLSAGSVSPADLAMALAQRLRLQYVELTEKDVDRSVTTLVESKVLRKHNMLPLRIENGRLVVAMSDPTNFYAIEDLRIRSGYPVTPVVAVEDEIQRVFNRVYALGGDVTRMLEDAAGESSEMEPGVVELGEHMSAENAPVIRLVGSILQRAVGEGASDIHFVPRVDELTVRMRVDGVLRKIMGVPPKLQSGARMTARRCCTRTTWRWSRRDAEQSSAGGGSRSSPRRT